MDDLVPICCFSHGYCPVCVAHFEERMAAYRPTTVWKSLREAGRCLFFV
jgi:hypothetical protein